MNVEKGARPALDPAFERDLFSKQLPSGFQSPALDYLEPTLNLHTHLIDSPASTFFFVMDNDSMVGDMIRRGDILIVNRAKNPIPGSIIVASINNEPFLVRKLVRRGAQTVLEGSGPADRIDITDETLLSVEGVLIGIARKL